jgi:hypothetical protein
LDVAAVGRYPDGLAKPASLGNDPVAAGAPKGGPDRIRVEESVYAGGLKKAPSFIGCELMGEGCCQGDGAVSSAKVGCGE